MKTPHSSKQLLAIAAAFAVALPTGIQAQTILPATTYRTQSAGAADTGASVTTTGTSSLFLGDGSGANSSEFRPGFEFNISSFTTQIAAATSITFSISITGTNGAPPAFDLFALTSPTDENGVASTTDYEAAATLVQSFTATSGTITADVTSFVKADSAAAQTFSGFRLQVSNPAVFPNGDGNADQVLFGTIGTNDARLAIVPEPATIAMVLGGIGLLALRRRR